MSLTRTTSYAACAPPRTAWRPLLPRLGYLLMPRRSPLAPWAVIVSVLPRAAREEPLVASTCRVFSVAWEFRVFLCGLSARFVRIAVVLFVVS
jgi:hypothetical protein